MKIAYKLKDLKYIYNILGNFDTNLEVIKTYFEIELIIDKDTFYTNATDKQLGILSDVLKIMEELSTKRSLSQREIIYLIKLREENKLNNIVEFFSSRQTLVKKANGTPIYPETFTQDLYVRAIEKEELIFGVGPAGTGKTYLAVAMAVKYLKNNKIKKLILTRPAVEAGEYLGYLPGDLKEKIDPYLRPLYDALYDFLGYESTNKLLESGVIEIAPLAYMRGKTLENAFIILDEAQNTTTMQMKMFLTRLGFNSKMIITGDPSQVDLPRGQKSGLIQALEILKEIPNVKIVNFKRLDVVRNPLVQKILEKYDELWLD